MKLVLVAALVPLSFCLPLARAEDQKTNTTSPSDSAVPDILHSGSNTTQKAINSTATTDVISNITTTVKPVITNNATAATKTTAAAAHNTTTGVMNMMPLFKVNAQQANIQPTLLTSFQKHTPMEASLNAREITGYTRCWIPFLTCATLQESMGL
ncbi:hypothetical protein JRQ81_019633 [Phrynocephalus forsythii]|uniref:Uncharacterized protein n=1 Tax=Phrynocephalus forsythii TaxID=171643 RepID=A0A9Q1AYQ3_9SAUR|nr:hypothetical protein JRQ81_019633 [Phrynocephalus forsythii]